MVNQQVTTSNNQQQRGSVPLVAGPRSGPRRSNGMITVELLVALGLITLVLGGASFVALGNQSLSLSTRLTNRALYGVEAASAVLAARARENLHGASGGIMEDGVFTFSTTLVSDDCFAVINSTAAWQEGALRRQSIGIKTLVASPEEARRRGGDCITSPPTRAWDNPVEITAADIGEVGATAIDVLGNNVYLTSNALSTPEANDFFIYEFSPESQTLVLRGTRNLGKGLNDVEVINGGYAFVASASSTAQLQVVDVSNPSSPSRIDGATRRLTASGSFPEGRVLTFYNNRLYVGTRETAGPELYIFDVTNPEDPTLLVEFELTHTIRDMTVRDGWLYIATTDNHHELMVINVDPSRPNYLVHPDVTGYGYDDAPGTYDGTAIALSGDYVFLGRRQNTSAPADDLFVLEREAVLSGPTTDDGLVESYDVDMQTGAHITALSVHGTMLFAGLSDANKGLLMFDINDDGTLTEHESCGDTDYLENGTGLDIEGYTATGLMQLFVFTSHRTDNELRVLTDQESLCS